MVFKRAFEQFAVIEFAQGAIELIANQEPANLCHAVES